MQEVSPDLTEVYFSVKKDNFFQEFRLPSDRDNWNLAHAARYWHLQRMAELYKTHVVCSNYSRNDNDPPF